MLAANAATSYTYELSQTVPCTTCSGQLGIAGTITVDALGALQQKDIIDWNLRLSTGTEPPIVMTPASSFFGAAGSLAFTATSTDLYITANSVPDGFQFIGNAGGIWEWGFQPPANILAYSNNWYGGESLGSLPATLTAAATSNLGTIGDTAVPEPGSRGYGLLVSAAALLAVSWRRHISRSQFRA